MSHERGRRCEGESENVLFRSSVTAFEEAMIQLREVYSAGASMAKQATEDLQSELQPGSWLRSLFRGGSGRHSGKRQ